MKQIVLSRVPAPASPYAVRCRQCVHLQIVEAQLGYMRAGCGLSHFPRGVRAPRTYSDHELANPSIELAAIARGCRDFASAAGDVA